MSGEVPSEPPTAYRKPPSTATATPSLLVLMEATRVHLFSFGSYLEHHQQGVGGESQTADKHSVQYLQQAVIPSMHTQLPNPVEATRGTGSYKATQILQSPLDDVETGDSVLPSHGVQVAPQDGHAHTGPARARWSHVAAPLVGLGVVSGPTGSGHGDKMFIQGGVAFIRHVLTHFLKTANLSSPT